MWREQAEREAELEAERRRQQERERLDKRRLLPDRIWGKSATDYYMKHFTALREIALSSDRWKVRSRVRARQFFTVNGKFLAFGQPFNESRFNHYNKRTHTAMDVPVGRQANPFMEFGSQQAGFVPVFYC